MASITSSTSTNSTSNLAAKTGIGGLVSGMDIDELVESLSSTSRQKIIKQQQNLQKLTWKQTAYRSVTTSLKGFQSKYLDVLSTTNLRSDSFYKTVSAASSSTKISASATASASAGSFVINSVTSLATNQVIKSGSSVSKPLTGKMTSETAGTMTQTDIENLVASLSGKSMSFNLDGKVRTVTFDAAFVNSVTADPTTTGLQTALQSKLDSAFGVTDPAKRVAAVSINNDQLTFTAAGSSLSVSSVGADTTVLNALGFTSGQSNKISLASSVSNASFASTLDPAVETFSFSINSVNFNINKGDSLSSIISRVNSSTAGVTMSYSSITDKFSLTAKDSGSGNNIVVTDGTGSLMGALGLTTASGAVNTAGENAVLSVNGQTITRSSNQIEIEGVKVTLTEQMDTPTTITMTQDASSLKATIKQFVDDYNTMIDNVNGLLKEDIDSDYQPLTDEQKDEMTEDQIKKWEDKAKSGILRNDTILKSISSKFSAAIAGTSVNGTSLFTLGITSAGYTSNGKLKIDDTKLDAALASKGAEIKELFTAENGIGNKLDDIITKATKTTGIKGERGTLVEVAGMPSTLSDTESSISVKLKSINKSIITLQNRLEAEEKRLWSKFSAMESALQSLNSQSSVLSQFSSGS